MKNREGNFLYKYVYNDEIIYIGMTKNIVDRIRQHASGHATEKKFKPYAEMATIYVCKCVNAEETEMLEALLIRRYNPKLNIIHPLIPSGIASLNIDSLKWELYKEDDYTTASERTSLLKYRKANEDRQARRRAFKRLSDYLEELYETDEEKALLLFNMMMAGRIDGIVD